MVIKSFLFTELIGWCSEKWPSIYLVSSAVYSKVIGEAKLVSQFSSMRWLAGFHHLGIVWNIVTWGWPSSELPSCAWHWPQHPVHGGVWPFLDTLSHYIRPQPTSKLCAAAHQLFLTFLSLVFPHLLFPPLHIGCFWLKFQDFVNSETGVLQVHKNQNQRGLLLIPVIHNTLGDIKWHEIILTVIDC